MGHGSWVTGVIQDGPPLHGDGTRDTGHVSADKLQQTTRQDPGLVNRARPGYPTALFTDLAGLADGPASGLAEIGPRTGRATTALLAGERERAIWQVTA